MPLLNSHIDSMTAGMLQSDVFYDIIWLWVTVKYAHTACYQLSSKGCSED